MQIKIFEIKKLNLKETNKILFYGNNEDSKLDQIKYLISKIPGYEKIFLNEKEITDNEDILLNQFLNKSLFNPNKIIIIKHATDKIFNTIKKIALYNFKEIILIIDSIHLEKKSKLRKLFEEDKSLVCTPFYPDTNEVLIKYAFNYLRDKKILISNSNINMIVNRTGNEKLILKKELEKIELLSKSKKITEEDVIKLTNLIDNHSISELVDNCLLGNKNQTLTILNENIFNEEDTILITRVFLNKTKKLLNWTEEYEKNKNLDLIISKSKPPIFWKDKDIIKRQILKWHSTDLKRLIFQINEIELQIKKNISNSIKIILNFITGNFFVKN